MFPLEVMAAMCAGEREMAFITIKELCPRRLLEREIGQQQREYMMEGELKKQWYVFVL